MSDKDLQNARQVINIFIQAWKNYGLYPEDHVNTQRSFEKLLAAFNNFFTDHEDLRLTVEKDRLLWAPEIIYKVSPEASSEDVTTLLYRDGIKWIEFQEGLPLEEIAAFFRIAHKYRLFAEETEGDIVTDLTDEELECIDFKAVDIFWQDLLLMDFSQLPPPAPPPQKDADPENQDQSPETEEPKGDDAVAESIALISHDRLELSNLDYVTLEQMVQEEEDWVITEDLIEALIVILKNQSGREKFEAVLAFIAEETIETIEKERFDLLAILLQSLHKLFSPESPAAKDWQVSRVNDFFRDLSRPEIFQLISDKLLQLETIEIDKLKAFGQALLYLSPELIPYLAPVILQSSSPEMQQMVSVVLVHLSRRDIGPLEKIAEQHGAEMGDRLLAILNRLQGDRVNKILFRMCDHSSDKVRRKAIKELVGRDPRYAQNLFSLIDDPSKEIRASVLAAFANQRSRVLENLLLNYLKENSTKRDPAHIHACYKALGRCGSNMSVPFLSRMLLRRGWNSFMGSGKLIFREGAAIALALLDTPEAEDVLQKASKSRFKVIRKAFARTKTIRGFAGEDNDE
ncbi:MAG: HEAT repeat domain-containing protein [Desulfobulbaceae bacterium]|nr:HEAT repeat domain-containing protein [Desulfobulbaceae bacterium]